MLTKDDKKFIVDIVTGAITKNNDVLVKEMIDLFNATNSVIEKVDNKLSNKIDKTNERIDDTNERIDRVLDNLRSDFDSIENLEKRTGKLEENVFPISA